MESEEEARRRQPEYLRGLSRGLLTSWMDPSSASSWFVSAGTGGAQSSEPSSPTVLATRPCLACRCRKDAFYCASCVTQGSFAHSRPSRVGLHEQFATLRIRQAELAMDLPGLSRRVEEVHKRTGEEAALRERIRLMKSRIRRARAAYEERKERLKKVVGVTAELRKLNQKRRMRLPEFSAKAGKIRQFSGQQDRVMRGKGDECAAWERKLAEERRRRVMEVAGCLYPVWEVFPVAREYREQGGHDIALEEDEDREIKESLLDAMDTSFVDGSWVTNTSAGREDTEEAVETSGEVQFAVVAPLLPSSGDYSAYVAWIRAAAEFGDLGLPASAEGGEGGDGHADHRPRVTNPAHAISAGLMFATHVTLSLASLLDVVLPLYARPRMWDFGRELLPTETDFGRRLARLNLAVFLLCLSQGVAPEQLKAERTAANLFLLYELVRSDASPVGHVHRPWTGRELLAAQAAGEEMASYLDSLPGGRGNLEALDDQEGAGYSNAVTNPAQEEDWDFVDNAAMNLEGLQICSSPPPRHQTPPSGASITDIASSFVSSFWGGSTATN